jgi:hypothetical protein
VSGAAGNWIGVLFAGSSDAAKAGQLNHAMAALMTADKMQTTHANPYFAPIDD